MPDAEISTTQGSAGIGPDSDTRQPPATETAVQRQQSSPNQLVMP